MITINVKCLLLFTLIFTGLRGRDPDPWGLRSHTVGGWGLNMTGAPTFVHSANLSRISRDP